MCFNFFECVVKLCTIKNYFTVRIIPAAVPVSVPVPTDTKKYPRLFFWWFFSIGPIRYGTSNEYK